MPNEFSFERQMMDFYCNRDKDVPEVETRTLAPDKQEKKPMTNGDRIRAMTDYELAEFMSGKIADQRFLCDSENGNELSIGAQMAVRHNHFCTWNKWLKQPMGEIE